ncbi:hypothetical protein A2767_00640 [Candidatus Roizmanbacteria bacterium RIFCSPHIGHO2_01_FULL_35_10]|uniref:Antitoxin n=1 Tax=Candidatus Roizmanbacteria bacterium RIFCSPLOWO2_01_FULL_35_13 TaxID=1802055 RepID=A0A1F7I8Z7_9BACT|nr:MAG: hypothetical protein A2767_00640 [Candidatus Roizmanbacteria bacterium RIFCSPHIGHO2_01_FULL_35_10]OGK39846.1 MAG: hypothetical protein A3A74_03065 [Candidatus Roizmanbacteria bacterium RIFCSPLOWO2_01_FULL_35_13]
MVTALCAASTTEVRIMLLTDAALKNMNITQSNIYPVSQARNMFSRLIDQIGTTKALYVTKKGKIRAALIDIDYLQKMQKDLQELYKKTYIDKDLLSYTREFTDAEIKEWAVEDKL